MATPFSNATDARRHAELTTKLKARTRSDGSPVKGYTRNVKAIRAEIAAIAKRKALETQPAADPEKSAKQDVGVRPAAPQPKVVFKPPAPLDTSPAAGVGFPNTGTGAPDPQP